MSEIRDLLRLAPCVEPLDRPGIPDFFDVTSGKFAYRFFRDCEIAPFFRSAVGFDASDAWILSDAAWLAYADARMDPETEGASEEAGRIITERIRPSLSRLFEALWARDGRTAGTAMELRTFVRVCPVVGVPDPVQCFVADDGNVGIVAFRGTVPTSLANWLTDCEVKMVDADVPAAGVPATGALVHEGFAGAARALIEDFGRLPGLRRYLAERLAASPRLRLWFTGHSLGAALATIAAYRLGRLQSLYTYGSPRVGNAQFARAFSGMGISHHRVVHRHDIVTRVPVSLPLFEYEHVGDIKYIDHESDADAASTRSGADSPPSVRIPTPEAPPADTWQRFLELTRHFHVGRVGDWLDPITDHAALYYSSLLWNELVREFGRGASLSSVLV